MKTPGEITQLLQADRDGDPEARDRVFELLYTDLRKLAAYHLGGRARTLGATAVVHEVYVKLVDQTKGAWNDRAHFLCVASRAMRQVIIDAAREMTTQKRGGGVRPETLDEERVAAHEDAERLLDINAQLEALSSVNPRLVRVVECRFFAGLTENETAEALELSVSSVQRAWHQARAVLRVAMAGS